MPEFQQNPIDETFSKGLKDAKIKAPDRVWDGISAQMENQRLRRKVLYAQWTAAAAVALLLAFGGWYVLQGPQNVLERAPQGQTAINLPSIQNDALVNDGPKKAKIETAELRGTRAATPPMADSRVIKNLTGKPSLIMPKKVSLWQLPDFQENDTRMILPEVRLDENIASVMQTPIVELVPNEDFLASFTHESDEEKHRGQSRFQIGASAGPDLAFQSQTPVAIGRVGSSPKTVLPKNAETAERTSTPAAAISASMDVAYLINDRISVQSGAVYTNRQSDTGHGILENGKAEVAKTHFDVSFLEVPVIVRYDILQGKNLETYVSGGASATMFLAYNSYFEVEGQVAARTVSDPKDAMSLAQANALVGAGVDIRLTDHLKLNMEPRLRYGLLTNERAFSQDRPVSLAGFTGLRYQF